MSDLLRKKQVNFLKPPTFTLTLGLPSKTPRCRTYKSCDEYGTQGSAFEHRLDI